MSNNNDNNDEDIPLEFKVRDGQASFLTGYRLGARHTRIQLEGGLKPKDKGLPSWAIYLVTVVLAIGSATILFAMVSGCIWLAHHIHFTH